MPKAETKNKAKTKKKLRNIGGAPTKYRVAYKEQARKLCLMGYIDTELADFFNISVATLNNWKRERPGFLESLKAGKEIADANVTASLYERATGYSCIDTKFATYEGEITDTKEYKKNYPPCPISIKYWLNNRQPERFREKVEVEVEQTLITNIMPVPAADNIDDWEIIAKAQQEEILNAS